MIEFLTSITLEQWFKIIEIVATVLIFILGYKKAWVKKNLPYIKEQLLTYVLEAEQLLGSKTGKAKKAYVYRTLYEKLPKIAKTFISYQTFGNIIDELAGKCDEMIKEKLKAEEKEKEFKKTISIETH